METMSSLPDEELITELTAIPGIGPWTVQGALIIALQREDVVLPGDLALRKAVQAAYQLDHLPAQQEVLAIAEKWRPYRSLATSYLFSATFDRAAFEPAEAPPVAGKSGTLHRAAPRTRKERRFVDDMVNPFEETAVRRRRPGRSRR